MPNKLLRRVDLPAIPLAKLVEQKEQHQVLLRIPRSLLIALHAQAKAVGTSLNQLAISKMMTETRDTLLFPVPIQKTRAQLDQEIQDEIAKQ